MRPAICREPLSPRHRVRRTCEWLSRQPHRLQTAVEAGMAVSKNSVLVPCEVAAQMLAPAINGNLIPSAWRERP